MLGIDERMEKTFQYNIFLTFLFTNSEIVAEKSNLRAGLRTMPGLRQLPTLPNG